MRILALLVVPLIIGCGRDGARAHPIPGDTDAAITVEVLNANGRAGDARVATRRLRDEGVDVVYFGNAPSLESGLDSTRIIVRRGTATVGERVRAALGRGRVEIALDSARLLDVSVLLGADFAPSARTRLNFHP